MSRGLLSRLRAAFAGAPPASGWADRVRHLVEPLRRRAGYEASATNRLNNKHWLSATGGDADSPIFAALSVLRNRARHEIRNSGYAEGLVETYVADCIGAAGPRLQIESDDENWVESVERGWESWSESCDLADKLHFCEFLRLAVREFFQSGESFIQKVTGDLQDRVRLRLLMIEADRISSPSRMNDQEVREGVRVDPATGRPLAFYVLKKHPGSSFYAGSLTEYSEVPARDMLHVFKSLRPGQTRGVPWLAPVLDLFGHLRDLTSHTLLAAQYAAALAVLLYTEHNDATFDDCDGVYDILDIEPGTLSMLPRGWRATQIKPEQPPAVYADFKHELLKEVGRVAGMPYLIVGADAAGHNYSSARMDAMTYWDHISGTQGALARHVCAPCLKSWVTEAYLSGAIPTPPARWRALWTWPQRKQVDQLAEEQAVVLRLANGTTTWAQECKSKGLDWQEVFKELRREMDFALTQGLHLDFGALMLAASNILSRKPETAGKNGSNEKGGQKA
jgi:lambda family phage portal protein